VMRYVDSLMRNTSFNPFLHRKHSTRILSGEEEGVFAWIAVNYLVGAFSVEKQESPDTSVPLVGILEMGGASTQIAFEPDGNIMAAKFPVLIGGWRYQLYVHSYLHYGQNSVDRRIKEMLIKSAQPNQTVIDPCMFKGDSLVEMNRSFTGGGDPTACRLLLERIVYKVPDEQCHTKPCGIGSFYQPTISPDMTFHGVGSFRYALKAIGALTSDGVYVPRQGFEAAAEYCTKSMTELIAASTLAGDDRKVKYIRSRCLVGLYTAVLFTRGYGFHNDTRRIFVVNEIANLSLEWTLGAVLYEDELDAIYSCGHSHQASPLAPLQVQSADSGSSSRVLPASHHHVTTVLFATIALFYLALMTSRVTCSL